MPDDDGPGVNVLLPLPARLAAVADSHPALGRDGVDESAGRLGARAHGPAVGRGGGMPAHGGGRPADVLRQRPDDLAQGGADRVVGVRGGVTAVERRHDQAKRLGGGEHQRRQPDAPADPVAAVGTRERLHGDAGLTQDCHVAARGPVGYAQPCRELAGSDAGLGLQQLQDPERSSGGTQVGLHVSRLTRKPIVRDWGYRRRQSRADHAGQPCQSEKGTDMDIVLIAGLWLDGSAWDSVAARLEARGHPAVPVTLPGQGDGSTSATLADHVAAVVSAVDAAAGRPMVVGHSAACTLAWLAADARPGKVSKIALIGGFPCADGEPYFSGLPIQGGAMPFPGWSEFEGPDSADLDDAARQAFT